MFGGLPIWHPSTESPCQTCFLPVGARAAAVDRGARDQGTTGHGAYAVCLSGGAAAPSVGEKAAKDTFGDFVVLASGAIWAFSQLLQISKIPYI